MKLADFGIKTWLILEWILKNEEFLVLWINAFFSAEVYVGEKSIKIQTVNEKGMKQLKKCLEELKIECRYYSYKPKKKRHILRRIFCLY